MLRKETMKAKTFGSFVAQSPSHMIQKDFKCKWGIEFMAMDEVVARKYYQKWGDSNSSFVLLKDSHDVYMYSHLIRVVKFLMPLKNHWVSKNDVVYELPPDAISCIRETITLLDLDD